MQMGYGGAGYLVDTNGVAFMPPMQMYQHATQFNGGAGMYVDSATGLPAHYMRSGIVGAQHSPGSAGYGAGFAQQAHMYGAAAPRYVQNGILYGGYPYAQGELILFTATFCAESVTI